MDDDANVKAGTGDDEEPRVYKIATLGGRRTFVETLAKGVAASGAAIAAGTCGGGKSSPTQVNTSTSSTAPLTWTLSGTVTDGRNGSPLSGVNVTIIDGPNANRSAVTDGSGAYQMTGLTQSGFTVRFCKTPTYDCVNKPVTLTSNSRLDCTLTSTTTTTSSRGTTSTTDGGCSCVPVHYWFPN